MVATVLNWFARLPYVALETILYYLRRSPVLRALPAATAKALAGRAHLRCYQTKKLVYAEGDPSDTIRLVANGSVDKVLVGENGREVVLRSFRAPDIFGLADVENHRPRQATCICAERTTIVELAARDCHIILNLTQLQGPLLDRARKDVRHLEEMLRRLAILSLEHRVAFYLKDQLGPAERISGQRVEIKVTETQRRIAAKVNATRTRVNITLQNWVKAGDITYCDNRVVINDPRQFWKRYFTDS
ncbi:Crp/Fnr family transcriptional regulator [uncultured Ruegeria sp.]|uniref:Crp/Fnr family transcriptional regulator n=1 Tax=uncultured Ruegeria sp. TaxID=259304 RepID=UPI00261DA9F7|nr:Crp/Fnr family transcriptional regulator [uncultured Ruegeria sp.]